MSIGFDKNFIYTKGLFLAKNDLMRKKNREPSGRTRRDALVSPAEFRGDITTWAAWLYYQEELTQEEISRRLGVSRGTVVTMLQEARTNGTVSITIKPEFLTTIGLARKISEKFGIQECLVVPRNRDQPQEQECLGRAGAQLLAERLKPEDVIGVSWGRAVLAVSQVMPSRHLPKASVVQITGSAIGTHRFTSEACAANIANRIGARCVYLHAPGIVSSAEAKNMFMKEPALVEQFRIISTCNKVIFGVGNVSAGSTAFESGFLSPSEGDPYRKKGAVAVIAGRFIDAFGRHVLGEADERMIGMTVDEIKKIPERFCVAAGADKVTPIHALLTGGFITTLITDEATAHDILAMPPGEPFEGKVF